MPMQTTGLIVLAQEYRGDLVNQINRRAVTLAIFGSRRGGGKNIAWAPKHDGAYAESYAEGANVTTYGSDGQASAIIPWSMYRANFSVSGLAKATSRTSSSPERNIELWAENMLSGAEKLADLMNKDIYTGVGPVGTETKFFGLDYAIGTDNNIYAGIDRTVLANAYWKPYIADNAGVPQALTFNQIRTDLATIATRGGQRPNVALVSPLTLVAIASLFDPVKQYIYEVMGAGGKVVLEGGTGAIYFDGCYFIEDKDATDGKIYYGNTRAIEMEVLPQDEPGPGMEDEVMDAELVDGFETIPIGLRLEMIARTGDADNAMMKTYLGLVVRRPNQCGVRKDILITP